MSSIPGLPTRGSDVTVLITRVHLNPLCRFVEFWGNFSEESTADYECLAKDIQSNQRTFKEFDGNPCDKCLVQINGTWYRSRIVSRNGSKYNVYLFDKGMTYSTTSNNLAWGAKEHFDLPPEVEFCVLANVLPLSPEIGWSSLALEFLQSFCGKSVKAHVQDVLLSHRLFLLHIPCLSSTMYEMGFAKNMFPDRFRDFVIMSLEGHSGAKMSPEAQLTCMGGEFLKQELFLYPELPAGTVETVIVTEVTNPQQVFCQLKVFSQELRKISDRLKQFCEGRRTNCIVGPEMIGCPCASKGNDGRWYRALLKEVFPASKTVKVLNVDYGTELFVQVEDVRPLAAEFFRMPVVTYTCSLHGITNSGVGWTSGQIDFLRNLLLSKTVIAKFEYQSVSQGVHFVTLFGDENININNLFGSKESCLLQTFGDFTIRSRAYNQQVADEQQANNQINTHGKKEVRKGIDVAEMLPAEELSPNSLHLAVVQHVTNPSEFWIQLQNYAREFNNLMNCIYDFYKETGNNVVRNPTVGLYCAARAEDGDFYRAVVAEVGEKQIKVFFVDYGNTEAVDMINIRTLPQKFMKLPRFALKCSLAGVSPKDDLWSQSASDFFIKVVTDKILKISVTNKIDDCYFVHLKVPETRGDRDLGTLMCSHNLAQRAETLGHPKAKMGMQPAVVPLDALHSGVYKNNLSSFQTQKTRGLANNKGGLLKFKEHMFPIGSVLDVSVSYIESPNDFWCQLVQNAGHLKLLMHDIQARYTGSEFQPIVEAACIARHPDNGMWYRALVVHKHETPHVDVLFVDYGQTETVSLYDLRRICPEFLTLQGQAFRCSLLNPVDPTSAVNEWNDEATARFDNFVETATSNFWILKCTIYAVMYSEQKIIFNIVDLETPFESICTSMVNLVKSASSQKISGPSFRLDTYYYSSHNIKTGAEEQMTVTCVNSVAQFYCQLERNTDVLKELNIKVRNLCCQLENVKLPPVFGSLCFAKYTDGQWYRGQIKGTKPAILVHFVDYGDTIEVDQSDLLPVPREANDIMSVPVQAVVCSLSDVPASVPREVNSWFEKSATDCKFQALVVAREPDGKLLVELYHGHTKINSKINKLFNIEMDTQEVVFQSSKAPQTSVKHLQKTSKAEPKHATEMEYDTKMVKICFSAPQPAHPLGYDSGSADSAPNISCKKDKDAPLQLYIPPHQRRACERTRNKGNSFVTKYPQLELKNGSTDAEMSCSPGRGSHEEIVQKLPKISDLPLNSVTLGMEADVYVSHFNTPLSFYIQLVREEDEIFLISEKLNDPKSSLKTDIIELAPGDLVQAEFGEDFSWYRAVVREVHADRTALVEFVDFGNTAVTPISKMATLEKSFLEFPVYSTHCMLSSAVDGNKEEICDPEVISSFKEIICVGEKVLKCKFIRQSGSVWQVNLTDNGVDVICQVTTPCTTGASKFPPKTIKQPVENTGHASDLTHVTENLSTADYKRQDFSKGEHLEVYVTTISDAHIMWCQCAASEDLKTITVSVSEVVAAADQKPLNSESLVPGSPCLALFSDDNIWYRAEVVKRDGDDLCVLFVDFGNTSQVRITDVKEIPPNLVKIPPQAFLCMLEGFDSPCGSWDSRAVDELSAITADKLLQLTVTRVEDFKYIVHMECDGQSINDLMKTWWKSPTTESKLHGTETTPALAQSLKHVSVVKESLVCKHQQNYSEVEDNTVDYIHQKSDNNKDQLPVDLTEPLRTDEDKLANPSETTTDILPCDGGIENTVDEENQVVFTVHYEENLSDGQKDSEGKGTSVIDGTGLEDVPFSLNEDKANNTDNISVSDRKASSREDSVTCARAVKMVPRETVFPIKTQDQLKTKEAKIGCKDLKQIETTSVLPSVGLPLQQFSDQEIEGEEGVPQEANVPCVTTHLKLDFKTEDVMVHHEDSGDDEPESCRVLSTHMVKEVTCPLKEACLIEVCTDLKTQSDEHKGNDSSGVVATEEMIQGNTLDLSPENEEDLKQPFLQIEMMSMQCDSVTEVEASGASEEKPFVLSSETEQETYKDNCSIMNTLVEQETSIGRDVSMTDCRDSIQDTEDSDPVTLTPAQPKEDFDSSVLSKGPPSHGDSYDFSKITHLSLLVGDDSSDFLAVKQQSEE